MQLTAVFRPPVDISTAADHFKSNDLIAHRFSFFLSTFQKLATDALQKMTVVFKKESTAGESYETLFDGAKSLVTGLASILRVSSHEARVYDSESLHESPTRDSFIAAPDAQNLRKYQTERNYGKIKTSLLSYLLLKRMKRNADYGESEAQPQVWFFIE